MNEDTNQKLKKFLIAKPKSELFKESNIYFLSPFYPINVETVELIVWNLGKRLWIVRRKRLIIVIPGKRFLVSNILVKENAARLSNNYIEEMIA